MSSVLVPHIASSAGLVRRRMSAELLARGLPADVVDDAALVVSELIGNAIRHGSPLPGGGVLADWALTDGVLRLEVIDGGDGVPAVLPARANVPGGGAIDDVEGGRGLTVVGMLSSAWGTGIGGRGRATTWAELTETSRQKVGEESLEEARQKA